MVPEFTVFIIDLSVQGAFRSLRICLNIDLSRAHLAFLHVSLSCNLIEFNQKPIKFILFSIYLPGSILRLSMFYKERMSSESRVLSNERIDGFYQVESTLAMQNLQPKLKAIQGRYKGDQERIQLETARLYKQAGVNPLAGEQSLSHTDSTLSCFNGIFRTSHTSANVCRCLPIPPCLSLKLSCLWC